MARPVHHLHFGAAHADIRVGVIDEGQRNQIRPKTKIAAGESPEPPFPAESVERHVILADTPARRLVVTFDVAGDQPERRKVLAERYIDPGESRDRLRISAEVVALHRDVGLATGLGMQRAR